MERRYDKRIGESYAAVEKTNFYDARIFAGGARC